MLTFQKYVHFMRTQFPPGSRVLLLSNDSPRPVPDGTMGTLTEVDAAGRFLVNWDTGKCTALNLEDDHFRIFQPELMELKLYFPLHGDLYTRNEWGDLADDPEELAGSELAPYLGDIREALQENQLPEEQERGLMHWYRESDALTWKVMDYDKLKQKREQLEQAKPSILLEKILQKQREFEIEYAHNSTALAGNSLTLEQTRAVLDAVDPPQQAHQEEETPQQTM